MNKHDEFFIEKKGEMDVIKEDKEEKERKCSEEVEYNLSEII